MDNTFWIKLALSFFVGSIWVTVSTVAAERYGSKIGGLIGGLPSTAVVALLFIGFTQTPRIASEATTVMPLVQGFNGLLMIAFILLARRGLFAGLSGALFIWIGLAGILVFSHLQSFWISIAGWICIALSCYLIVEKVLAIPSRDRIDIHYTPAHIMFRALFGGSVIGFAVLMGKIGGPTYGGIFAAFPAMFLSAIIITYRSGGPGFARAVAKSLLVSGLINVVLYVIAVRFLYLRTGLIAGTLLAILFSWCTGYLTYLFIRSKLS